MELVYHLISILEDSHNQSMKQDHKIGTKNTAASDSMIQIAGKEAKLLLPSIFLFFIPLNMVASLCPLITCSNAESHPTLMINQLLPSG